MTGRWRDDRGRRDGDDNRRQGYDPRNDTTGRRVAQDVRQFGDDHGRHGERQHGGYVPGRGAAERSYGGQSDIGRQGAFNAPLDRGDRQADPDDWSGSRGEGGYASHGDNPQWAYDAWEHRHDSYGGWRGASSAQRGPKGYARSDERLKDEIHERIMQSDVDASDVSIEVHDGHVTLDGTVGDRFTNFQLEEMVARVIGVRDVDNRVKARRVTGPDRGRR
jgi:hypothetical protein